MSASENPLAFPCANEEDYQSGMTLRDWFAGQAMAGLFADSNYKTTWEECARDCYRQADAFLAERLRDRT